jgi:hypothetical protein
MYSRRFDLSRWRISKDQERQPIREGRVMLTRIADQLVDASKVIAVRTKHSHNIGMFDISVVLINGTEIYLHTNLKPETARENLLIIEEVLSIEQGDE